MDKSRFKTSRSIANLKEGRNDWYRIENAASGSPSVYIYDEIGYFGVTASDFVSDLNAIKADSIDVHVNSPGGDVFDGVAIYNALLNHSAQIHVYVDGLAASAASFITMAGDTVTMMKTATMMIHDASGLVIGNSADMAKMIDLLDQASDNIASIYADKAGGSVESWRSKMKDETWYTADEAVKAGLADEVAKGKATNKVSTFDLSMYSYQGRKESPAPVIDEAPDFDPAAFREAMQKAWR